MPRPQINKNGVWIRRIHYSWENFSGYRTDIRESVLNDRRVKKAAYVLDDNRAILVPIEEVREALRDARRRENGCVGPYNVNPHNETLNGRKVTMEIRDPWEKNKD